MVLNGNIYLVSVTFRNSYQRVHHYKQWQGASIDIKAAHKRMLIKEEERGALLFQFETRHFGAKTSAWHGGRVSGALLRPLHKVMYFRHAVWVYVDDFLFLFLVSTAQVQFALAIVLLGLLGTPSLGRNWNLEVLSDGMDGPSVPHR